MTMMDISNPGLLKAGVDQFHVPFERIRRDTGIDVGASPVVPAGGEGGFATDGYHISAQILQWYWCDPARNRGGGFR